MALEGNGKKQALKVKNHFNSDFIDYDTCDEFVVPKNDELHEVIVDFIPFAKEEKFHALDLGVGTGTGAFKILKYYPNAFLTGVDFSRKMISRAEEKLKRFNDRVKLIEGDFNAMKFPEKYDFIYSAVAIHNNRDEEKRNLFNKIFDSLNENCFFINGDFFKSSNERVQKKFNEFYRDLLERNLSGRESEAWIRHAFEEDKPSTIEEQFSWLEEIGFKEMHCIWQYYNTTVYYAKK
ncbi:MAG: class I SAM-dependent methyltransferase [archaeon]|nr:class I SAM-dependent methyltransferase [Candidatus Micrarchaeota archaeon]